jgi:UDP-GlcNAc:undecaprenyl-phosphate GlcNAc-1-phosphate transferase
MSIPERFASLVWPFACALAISWLLTALLLRLAPRLGLVDYPSDRKVHVRPTPRAGGLAIFAASFVTSLLFSWDVSRAAFFFWQWSLAAMIVLLGLLDDWRPLPWQGRLFIQFAVALIAVIFCLPSFDWWMRALAVLWIAGLINAFNMLDNMDALSAGVAWIAAAFFALVVVEQGGYYVILMGALTGFLWFNRPPARIFMGDAGSTFLGFTLGLGSVQVILKENAPAWSWAVPPCILAVPCYDLVSVVLLRLSQGRSPFHADKQHLSHRLVGRGLSGPRAVGVIYLLALASGASGLILYAVTSGWLAALVVGQLAVWWLALAVTEFMSKESGYDPQTQDRLDRDHGSASRR